MQQVAQPRQVPQHTGLPPAPPPLQAPLSLPGDDAAHPLAERFRAFIRNPPFPCVGAKSALTRGRLRIAVARDITGGADDARLYGALLAFLGRYKAQPDLFQSFAVVFEGPHDLSEEAFEGALWARAQALADQDCRIGHAADPRVADDPDDPHFSLSLAGEAFFIVGLHPRASRLARRFEAPVLVFNLHDQFERLRETILARDVDLAGSVNPMLARHGERSEAVQYSGRAVPADWACPFRRGAPEPGADWAAVARDLSAGAFDARRLSEAGRTGGRTDGRTAGKADGEKP